MIPASFTPLAAFSESAIVAVGEGGIRRAAELRRDVLAVAARLPPATPGSEIMLVCGDRYCFAVGVLAAWEAGHGVALPPNTQPEVIRHLSRRAALLLHDTDAGEGVDLRGWLAAAATTEPPERRLAAIASDRHLATVYTSGTTGDHQACAKTAGQLLGEATVLAATFAIRGGDRVLATVPPHHIYGLLFGILMPLVAGASFVRDTPFHAETVAATARRTAARVLVSAPVHLRSLTVLEDGSLPPFVRVFSSGARLPPAAARALIESHGLRVTEVFGSSETGGIAWRVSETCDEPWRALPGIAVDVDIRGRLLLDSPFLPPEEARPYIASDRIALVPGGFHLRGRADGVIKIGGKRVALAEVESQLLALPGVVDGAVVAVAIPGARGHALSAAVVVDPGLPGGPKSPNAWVAAIRSGLRQWFDPVVVPRRICLVDQLPREANGKLRRQRLLEVLGLPAAIESAVEGTPPASPSPIPGQSADRGFAIRSHAVRRQGEGAVHEITVEIPETVDAPAPALARVLAQVIGQVAGLGRPQRMQGVGLRYRITAGDALLLRLEIEPGPRRVHFALERGGERCSDGIVDYAGDPGGGRGRGALRGGAWFG